MLINLWRPNLKTWLSTYVLIDSWELRNPVVYNKTNGFIMPLSAIKYEDGTTDMASATSDFYLTIRYPSDLKYDQLPLAQLEQLYTTIVLRLRSEYSSISPLLDFEMAPVNECILVQEYGDELADWLVTLSFSCKLSWVPETAALPGGSILPINLSSINVALYTEETSSNDHLDPSTRNKVGDIQINQIDDNISP